MFTNIARGRELEGLVVFQRLLSMIVATTSLLQLSGRASELLIRMSLVRLLLGALGTSFFPSMLVSMTEKLSSFNLFPFSFTGDFQPEDSLDGQVSNLYSHY